MRIRRRVMVRRRLIPRRIRHHPLTRIGAVVVVVLLLGPVLERAVVTSVDTRRKWGEQRTVTVARHRIAIGSVVEADAVATESWPVALVPQGAVEQSPVGRTVVGTIEAGEAVLGLRLAPEGLSGIAALLPPGSRALAVPTGPSVVALRIGDHVDLIAGFDVAGATGDNAPALTVAQNAVVVSVDDKSVTVAVRAADAERVAFALVAGTVVPALRAT
jgi:Flp pilus assembly protein CpaB